MAGRTGVRSACGGGGAGNNPFADDNFSFGKGGRGSPGKQSKEHVVDFESNDQPDMMRSNGAYSADEPEWFRNASRSTGSDDEPSPEPFADQRQRNGQSELGDSDLNEQLIPFISGKDGGKSQGRKQKKKKARKCCGDGKGAKLYLVYVFLLLTALASLAIFSFSILQQTTIRLNIGTGCDDSQNTCLDLSTPKQRTKEKCYFQNYFIAKGKRPQSCGATKFIASDRFPSPVRFKCSFFPEGDANFIVTPWPQTNFTWRTIGSAVGFVMTIVYFFMIRRCDCCVSFCLSLVTIAMFLHAIFNFICCIMDVFAVEKSNNICADSMKVLAYSQTKKHTVTGTPMCANGEDPCKNHEFVWMMLASAVNGVLWLLTGAMMRSWQKHKAIAPQLDL